MWIHIHLCYSAIIFALGLFPFLYTGQINHYFLLVIIISSLHLLNYHMNTIVQSSCWLLSGTLVFVTSFEFFQQVQIIFNNLNVFAETSLRASFFAIVKILGFINVHTHLTLKLCKMYFTVNQRPIFPLYFRPPW